MAATKNELVVMAAKKCAPEITQRMTAEVLEAVMASIIEIVSSGDELRLRGFGTFRVQRVAPRHTRHPGTRELMEIPEKFLPQFKPSDPFKDAVAAGAGTNTDTDTN
ncbi:HU family DNA-binding protein [Gordonia sihwensis]|uniref:HU family DNA-binding protein n=1 Tax=Gordonia sihwensis TaxID=173559 RepID=UPI003D97C18B